MEQFLEMDKIKIRTSEFLRAILVSDAITFGFLNSKGKANLSGFLNKMIPNMYRLRRARSEALYEEIVSSCQHVTEKDFEIIQDIVDRVVDKVYFPDADLGNLTREIWIRPTQKAQLAFMEIEEESLLTDGGFSTYLRSMLNEYCKLPQYKRETIVFDEELQLVFDGMNQSREVVLLAKGEKYSGVPLNCVYGAGQDQQTYVFMYDIGARVIQRILLKDIKRVFVTACEYVPDSRVFRRMREIYDQRLFLEQTEFPIAEAEG